jgi:hypothetical protein
MCSSSATQVSEGLSPGANPTRPHRGHPTALIGSTNETHPLKFEEPLTASRAVGPDLNSLGARHDRPHDAQVTPNLRTYLTDGNRDGSECRQLRFNPTRILESAHENGINDAFPSFQPAGRYARSESAVGSPNDNGEGHRVGGLERRWSCCPERFSLRAALPLDLCGSGSARRPRLGVPASGRCCT